MVVKTRSVASALGRALAFSVPLFACNCSTSAAGTQCTPVAPGGDWAMWTIAGDSPNGFRDNQDGTITDLTTCLQWQKAATGPTMTWDAAVGYCSSNAAQLPGKGWRLPERIELVSLVDYVRTTGPTIDTSTFSAVEDVYWTATPSAPGQIVGSGAYRWTVEFGDGVANGYVPDYPGHVRCVH